MPNIVSAKEVGQYLKLSGSTIYKLAANSEVSGFRIGDSWRFDTEGILKLIQEHSKLGSFYILQARIGFSFKFL
jgi:excisionase family DNA binding protein